MSSSPTPTPSKNQEVIALDALTGGVFSAATSGERAARLRSWLESGPSPADMQQVYRVLSARDKGTCRLLRDRLDELRRQREQETLVAEWAARAQALLDHPRMNIADALAWQRDAARAGAPLSREPLAALRQALTNRVKAVDDLQHRVQVQREAAVLLAQRIETLSTKGWQEAAEAAEVLAADVPAWLAQADALMQEPAWASLDARQAPLLDASREQLRLVWEAFQAALTQARIAAADPVAPLPSLPVWADQIRNQRMAQSPDAAPRAATVAPERRNEARQAVLAVLATLESELAAGHGKATVGAAAALRSALKEHGRLIDEKLEHRAQAALAAAGELEDWQRWRADQLRQELVAQAEGLFEPTESGEPRPRFGGRRMQEILRELRERWKQTDTGGPPNLGLWRRFDAACNRAHQVVDAWVEKQRAEAAETRARRLALIDELNAWAAQQPAVPDWKETQRSLHRFAERWREAGHLSEKAFAELQPLWKQALEVASAPFVQAQQASIARRQALIDEATRRVSDEHWRVDDIKALQQRWQAEAQSVPLDRRQEQKLWDAFRAPIDAAFQRRQQAREQVAQAASVRDRQVLEAVRQLDEAIASGDAERIRSAQAALSMAVHGQSAAPPAAASVIDGAATVADSVPVAAAAEQPAAKISTVKPLVAVRGDDRPVARSAVQSGTSAGASQDERPGRTGAWRDRRESLAGRPDRRTDPYRDDRSPRGRSVVRDHDVAVPRLSPAAMRAQRDAQERAAAALRGLAARAHDEALAQLIGAWEQRNPDALPPIGALGRGVSAAQRGEWVRALSVAAGSADAGDALLRLEIAAEVPTPAEYRDARRLLQLQLLTRRHEAPPSVTWPADLARVLGSPYSADQAQRLLAALTALARKR